MGLYLTKPKTLCPGILGLRKKKALLQRWMGATGFEPETWNHFQPTNWLPPKNGWGRKISENKNGEQNILCNEAVYLFVTQDNQNRGT